MSESQLGRAIFWKDITLKKLAKDIHLLAASVLGQVEYSGDDKKGKVK